MSYEGTKIKRATERIVLTSISPEAETLLDEIMCAWEKHRLELRAKLGRRWRASVYGFAYWLVRYSGLIRPAARTKKKRPRK